eukprot:10244758-Lingulodinium_polyedra.AAC.1
MPLKTQESNAHIAPHTGPRKRISALRVRTIAWDASRRMASAGCFLSPRACVWPLPAPLSQDTRTLHFQGRTSQIPRAEPRGQPKVHKSPAETHAETGPEERAGGQ